MKQPKKLNRRQKEILSDRRLNPDNWMLVKEEPDYMVVKNKSSGRMREIEL